MRSACLSYFLECINIRSSIASVGSARRSLVRCSEQRERWRRPPKVVAIGFEEVRLFSKVDRKHKIPLFLFSFFVKPFSKGTQNQKWGQIFLCFGILKHKKGSKFVSEERRHTKHKSVNGEGGGTGCAQQWKG